MNRFFPCGDRVWKKWIINEISGQLHDYFSHISHWKITRLKIMHESLSTKSLERWCWTGQSIAWGSFIRSLCFCVCFYASLFHHMLFAHSPFWHYKWLKCISSYKNLLDFSSLMLSGLLFSKWLLYCHLTLRGHSFIFTLGAVLKHTY